MNKENAAGIEMELKETFDVQLSRAISSHHHHTTTPIIRNGDVVFFYTV